MSDPTILGAAVFFIGVAALVAGCWLVTTWLRERAYQRWLEAQYAEQWRLAHKAHQDSGRYLTSDDRRPE